MELPLTFKASLYQNDANASSQEFGLNVNYDEIFHNGRIERALSLRRNRCFDMLSKKSESWPGRFDKSLSHKQIISILNDPSHSQIKALNSILSSEKSIIIAISKNLEIWESFINVFAILGEFDQTEDAVIIMHSVSFLFPYASEENQENISNSLIIYFQDLLETPNFMIPTLLLINTFSRTSAYARDAIICYGIHSLIFNKLSTAEASFSNEEEIQLACHTIMEIYFNPAEIEDEIIFESVDALFTLINPDNEIIIKTAFDCLTNLTDRKSCVADILFEKNIFEIVLSCLDSPDLISDSLQFIASLVHNISKIDTEIVSNCLLPPLFALISSDEYISDIFRVLAHLIQKIPRAIFDFLTDDFIHSALSLSLTANITVKIEAAYFFATCIRYFKTDRLKSFLQNDCNGCIDLLDEMLASGIKDIILRCVETLTRVIFCLSDDPYVLSIISNLEESGIIKDLYNLVEEEEDNHLIQMILDLMNIINRLCNEDGSV